MLKLNYVDLKTFFRTKLKAEESKRMISLAVGIAISRIVSIPSSAIDDAPYHYDTVIKFSATSLACDFNENIVVDMDLVAEMARSFWLVRYCAAHPDLSTPLISVGGNDFMDKLFSLWTYVSPEINSQLDKNSDVLILMVNRIISVLNPVNESAAV